MNVPKLLLGTAQIGDGNREPDPSPWPGASFIIIIIIIGWGLVEHRLLHFILNLADVTLLIPHCRLEDHISLIHLSYAGPRSNYCH